MIRIAFPKDEKTNDAFAKWVMDRLNRPAVRPYRTIAAVDEQGRIVGGVVFNGYNGANVDLTAYAPGLISARAMRIVFRYAFEKLKATRVTARTARGRQALLGGEFVGKALERMGFVREAVAVRYYGDGRANDAIVYRMLRRECPWIGGKDGFARDTRPKRDGGRAGADESRNRDHAGRAEQLQPGDAIRQSDL